ncbi:hypothetical protein MLD38_035221 [Melastoma candidum]|uniref:Uncharacterized protein n=1 Tax=Melastoma candidum TaxID=119954 RepID=A0ACB9MEL2_9MYRT|nr:hypothetical protein MLD38_035221 [Melastoma candidum]
MAVVGRRQKPRDSKALGFCRFWRSSSSPHGRNVTASSSSSSTQNLHNSTNRHDGARADPARCSSDAPPHGLSGSVYSITRLFIPPRRRLRLDPPNNLYFPYEPGKQARSAVRLKNSSRSHVAFKFQTTAPKSCYMRPPGGILAPGESIIATVFKFVEHPEANEKHADRKCKVKFKIVSLKVKAGTYYVPELFDELKDQVKVEQVLRVVFLDVKRPSPAMDKLKCQLAEAEAALETRKKPLVEKMRCVVGDRLVIDEWKERRVKYLARQQVEAADAK